MQEVKNERSAEAKAGLGSNVDFISSERRIRAAQLMLSTLPTPPRVRSRRLLSGAQRWLKPWHAIVNVGRGNAVRCLLAQKRSPPRYSGELANQSSARVPASVAGDRPGQPHKGPQKYS